MTATRKKYSGGESIYSLTVIVSLEPLSKYKVSTEGDSAHLCLPVAPGMTMVV